MAEVGIVIADINRFAIGRKRTDNVLSAVVHLDQEVSQALQVDDTFPPQVENLAVDILTGRRHEECLYGVINVCEIAQLLSTPDLKSFAFYEKPDPEPQKGLTGILNAHVRAIRIGQTQDTRPNSIRIVIQDMVLLPCPLIDAIHIDRAKPMLLIHGQVVGPAIELAGTGEHDLNGTVVFSAGFQNGQLSTRVDVQISEGIMHRVQVTGLSG